MASNQYTYQHDRTTDALQNNEKISVDPCKTNTDVTKLHSILNDLKNLDLDGVLTLTTTLSRTQEQLDNICLELAKKKKDYDDLRQAHDSNIQQTQRLEEKYEQLQTMSKKLMKEAKEKAATEADEQIQNRKRQLREKEKEIRLKKETGGILNNNNSDIAFVSDPYRPSKVAEMYNTLYNNDWTDALHYLQSTGFDEETGIRILLEIKKLSMARKADDNLSEDNEDKHAKQILESCSEARTKTTIQNLQREYSTIGYTSKPLYVDKLPDYTNNCIEVCWLMNTHNPPLVFAEPVASGQLYDKDLYREFTKQGDKVGFLVWLPMLIEEGGVVLSKGVVQPVPLIRSEQKLQRYSRPGSAKTKPEPRTAWVTESSQMARGREKNTYDQDLQRRDESSNFGIGNRFDNLGNFGTTNSDEVSKNYQGGLTYTKNVDPHVDDMFNSTTASRPKYQNYSPHRDDTQSTNMPIYKQFTSKSGINTVSSQYRSQNYSDGLRTEDRSLASRPSSSPVYKTRYTSIMNMGRRQVYIMIKETLHKQSQECQEWKHLNITVTTMGFTRTNCICMTNAITNGTEQVILVLKQED